MLMVAGMFLMSSALLALCLMMALEHSWIAARSRQLQGQKKPDGSESRYSDGTSDSLVQEAIALLIHGNTSGATSAALTWASAQVQRQGARLLLETAMGPTGGMPRVLTYLYNGLADISWGAASSWEFGDIFGVMNAEPLLGVWP